MRVVRVRGCVHRDRGVALGGHTRATRHPPQKRPNPQTLTHCCLAKDLAHPARDEVILLLLLLLLRTAADRPAAVPAVCAAAAALLRAPKASACACAERWGVADDATPRQSATAGVAGASPAQFAEHPGEWVQVVEDWCLCSLLEGCSCRRSGA